MPLDPLRVATYVAYLAAWLLVACAALLGLLRGKRAPTGTVSIQGTVGTVLQILAVWLLTRTVTSGSLQTAPWELVGTLILAPLSAWLFVWAQVPATRADGKLLTEGAYRWVRNPMYLAFLGMLIATGLVVSAGLVLVAAIAMYLAGTEMRIALEESQLEKEYSDDYNQYRRRTRWLYLPGVR